MADGAPVTLSNTGFLNNSQFSNFGNAIDGLRIQSNVAGLRSETIGAVTLGAGANQITGAPSSTSGVIELHVASLSRGTNNSTLLIRGTNLGTVTAGTLQGFELLVDGGRSGAGRWREHHGWHDEYQHPSLGVWRYQHGPHRREPGLCDLWHRHLCQWIPSAQCHLASTSNWSPAAASPSATTSAFRPRQISP
ncbi:MAG: hypothetical protein WDN28_13150 [Chthoniobacter sp.]